MIGEGRGSLQSLAQCLVRDETAGDMGGCDPFQGAEPPTCQHCMDYGIDAPAQCVYSGCQWRNFEADCVEGRDRLKVATGMWMLAAGWLLMVWVGGWARRNCGKVQKLQRSGRRVSAEALSKMHTQRMVMSSGWPVRALVFTVRVRYPSETAHGGWLDHDVTVTRENYEAVEEGSNVAVVVDKSDSRFVLAASVVDADRERFGWIVLSIAGAGIVPALLFGGFVMMLDAYHCWLAPSCCDDADPNNASDTPCDGVGGRSHWAVCEAPCDQGYMTWVMMSSMFGIMMSFMIVLLRSGSGLSSSDEDEPGCSWTKAGNFCFGSGEFCSEEDPNLVAFEIMAPQRPSSPGADSRENGNVPNIDRGVTMLDRTFRGIPGGSRHYPEQPLTEEEARLAEEELQREEERRRQEARSGSEFGDETQKLVDGDRLHDDDAWHEESSWDDVQEHHGENHVRWMDDAHSDAHSVDTELQEPDSSTRDFAAPLPTYQA